MAVSVNDLTVRIKAVKPTVTRTSTGFVSRSSATVGWFWANWLPLTGSDESASEQFTAQARATVTVRYTQRITPDCLIYLAGDATPWEIVGPVNALNGKREFSVFKVERKEVTL